ncbi:uncharacterized protein LOC125437840 [Sphaerodactylus townsendi]|uniref:uncharacterized protein LOC125437840 n=1 Tax=Sphaerodactylus townsendi TaxID=933632 RepID=UPI002025CF9A|nr:uncharacterized protein LOC125437840 [Sphaerodactylus townsendi]
MVASLLEVGPTLLSAMAAVERLSKFQPKFSAPLRRSLETWGLRLVLGRPSVPGEEGAQAPGSAAEKGLLAMLAGLLREDPSAGHLASLLEQLVYWAQVDWEAPRHRSIKVILDLLGAMRELPSINILEGDGLGSLVVQLAVSLADPEGSIREKAREVMSQLLTMLLRRRGLRGKRPRLVWAQDAQRPWRASCFDLVSIYELFWNHLSIGQQSSFREAALQHALLLLGRRWAREAGLILLYSSIGQARPLLEEQDEDYLKGDLAHLLYNLQMGRSPLKPQLCAGKEGSSCCCCWVCSKLPSSDPAQTERQGGLMESGQMGKRGAVCRKGL